MLWALCPDECLWYWCYNKEIENLSCSLGKLYLGNVQNEVRCLQLLNLQYIEEPYILLKEIIRYLFTLELGR